MTAQLIDHIAVAAVGLFFVVWGAVRGDAGCLAGGIGILGIKAGVVAKEQT